MAKCFHSYVIEMESLHLQMLMIQNVVYLSLS